MVVKVNEISLIKRLNQQLKPIYFLKKAKTTNLKQNKWQLTKLNTEQ